MRPNSIVTLLLASFVASAELHADLVRRASSTHAEIWTEDVSEELKASYDGQAALLKSFLEREVIEKLPPGVAEEWGASKTIIHYQGSTDPTDVTQVAGRFIQPREGDSGGELDISMSQFFGPDAQRTLAHEFFHALHFKLHGIQEERWLAEGLAQYFEYLVLDRMHAANVSSAMRNLDTALLGPYPDDRINPAQYGHAFLYIKYLADHCGGEDLFWKLTRGIPGKLGKETVDQVLADVDPGCRGFSGSRRDFEVARALNRVNMRSDRPKRYFLDAAVEDATPVVSSSGPNEVLLIPSDQVRSLKQPKDNYELIWIHRSGAYEVTESPPLVADASWFLLALKRL